jgi:hypothetical protein
MSLKNKILHYEKLIGKKDLTLRRMYNKSVLNGGEGVFETFFKYIYMVIKFVNGDNSMTEEIKQVLEFIVKLYNSIYEELKTIGKKKGKNAIAILNYMLKYLTKSGPSFFIDMYNVIQITHKDIIGEEKKDAFTECFTLKPNEIFKALIKIVINTMYYALACFFGIGIFGQDVAIAMKHAKDAKRLYKGQKLTRIEMFPKGNTVKYLCKTFRYQLARMIRKCFEITMRVYACEAIKRQLHFDLNQGSEYEEFLLNIGLGNMNITPIY